MKRYKVIALSVGGRNNKVYHLNDEVTDSNFPEGNAKELERQGFLKALDASDEAAGLVSEFKEEVKTAVEEFPVAPQGSILAAAASAALGEDEVTIDTHTAKELRIKLEEAGIEVPANAKKTELFERLREAKIL